jgi:hypothetical protein
MGVETHVLWWVRVLFCAVSRRHVPYGVPIASFIYTGGVYITLEEPQMPPDTQPTCE